MNVTRSTATAPAIAIRIRVAIPSDLPQLILLHKAAFPGFFLTLLGDSFLLELYRGFLFDSSSLCLMAEDQQARRLLGFVVGTMEPTSFFKRLLMLRAHRFIFSGVRGLLHNPKKVVRRFLDALAYRGEAPQYLERPALLSSIAVAPAMERCGIGATLVDRFCQQARLRGVRWVYLVTDVDGNPAANQFYLKCGFALDASFERPDGRRMIRYIRRLDSRSPDDAPASGMQ